MFKKVKTEKDIKISRYIYLYHILKYRIMSVSFSLDIQAFIDSLNRIIIQNNNALNALKDKENIKSKILKNKYEDLLKELNYLYNQYLNKNNGYFNTVSYLENIAGCQFDLCIFLNDLNKKSYKINPVFKEELINLFKYNIKNITRF